jgi:hypothetical protein
MGRRLRGLLAICSLSIIVVDSTTTIVIRSLVITILSIPALAICLLVGTIILTKPISTTTIPIDPISTTSNSTTTAIID